MPRRKKVENLSLEEMLMKTEQRGYCGRCQRGRLL